MLCNPTDAGAARKLMPEFVDHQMGLPVLLVDSAVEVEVDEKSGIIVPDIAGLETAMAVARVMDDAKLTGKELKFLRKALGMRAVELADFLSMTPETLSRCENDKEQMNTNTERVFRMRVFNVLGNKTPGVLKRSADIILEMKFRAARPIGEALMKFRHMTGVDIWIYEGRSESNVVQFPTKISA